MRGAAVFTVETEVGAAVHAQPQAQGGQRQASRARPFTVRTPLRTALPVTAPALSRIGSQVSPAHRHPARVRSPLPTATLEFTFQMFVRDALRPRDLWGPVARQGLPCSRGGGPSPRAPPLRAATSSPDACPLLAAPVRGLPSQPRSQGAGVGGPVQ